MLVTPTVRCLLGAALATLCVGVGDVRAAAGDAAGHARAGTPDRAATKADVRAPMRRLRKLGVPSVRTLIVTPGRREGYVLGHRRAGGRKRARIGDRMRVGSVTKMLTASVVMQLVEEGRLRLEDPVEGILPGVVPGGAAITIEQLLGMRSGLATYNTVPAFARAAARRPRRDWRPRELLRFAFGQPARFAPGGRYEYSNTNTIVLGLVVEALTGRSYAEAVRDRVVRPLRLRRTAIPTGHRLARPRVGGYVFAGSRLRNVTSWSPSWGWSAGAAISTPPEIGRFMRALMAGRVVEPTSIGRMLGSASRFVSPPFPPMEYGLGLSEIETTCGPLYGHAGEISGYRTWVAASRDGRRSVVVSASIGATVDGELPVRVERAMTAVLDAAACRRAAR